MASGYRGDPHFDYDDLDDEAGPQSVYLGRLELVFVGDRLFLHDTFESDFYPQLDSVMPRDERAELSVVRCTLSRDVASRFSLFMDPDAISNWLPEGHPFGNVRLSGRSIEEISPDDPRLADLDVPAMRAAAIASIDQAEAGSWQQYGGANQVSVEDLPPLD